MADWTTISSLATATGTLVLAVATFSSVRSANRAARTAERSLLAGQRPLLVPSRMEDPPERIVFGGGHWVEARGGYGVAESTEEVIYLAVALRNAGQGIAVLDRWRLTTDDSGAGAEPPDLDDFRRLTRDIYVPPRGLGFWQGSFRDRGEPGFKAAAEAIAERRRIDIDMLYGDHEGGQRTVTRFSLLPADDDDWLTAVTRHWHLDRDDPRA